MMENTNTAGKIFQISVSPTRGKCPAGEKIGAQSQQEGKIPVLSCEGACIRGEIARLAANRVGKAPGYQRGCHGELFTVPDAKISHWILDADKVVCIDGCFLKCHSRILKNMIAPAKLEVFDALSYYKKYSDLFDIDDVPEAERKQTAEEVAGWVLKSLADNKTENPVANNSSCGA